MISHLYLTIQCYSLSLHSLFKLLMTKKYFKNAFYFIINPRKHMDQ